jgi:hypothetical protein
MTKRIATPPAKEKLEALAQTWRGWRRRKIGDEDSTAPLSRFLIRLLKQNRKGSRGPLCLRDFQQFAYFHIVYVAIDRNASGNQRMMGNSLHVVAHTLRQIAEGKPLNIFTCA